ncbi:MAG: pilus assembly FimT family protein [Candidatus Nitrospinota bacterium M3_3B_026]
MRRRGGFTLIELIIVMVIIGVLAGMTIPRLPDVTASRLKYASRRIAGTITYLYDRAAGAQLVLRLTFDMEKNEYYVSLLNTENQFEETSFAFAKRKSPPWSVRVTGATTATQGEVAKGKAVVHFFPSGYVEPAVIHLEDNAGNEMTLITHPLTGRVRILEGYHDVERPQA